MKRWSLVLVLVLPALVGWDLLRSPEPDVHRGNAHYERGEFSEALVAYSTALDGGGDLARVHFNIGAALYRRGEQTADATKRKRFFERATFEFRLGADTRDVALRSSSLFNLGNALFQEQQWTEAVAAYKRALRMDSGNKDALYNLELALRRLKQDQAMAPVPVPVDGRDRGSSNRGTERVEQGAHAKGTTKRSRRRSGADPAHPKGAPDGSERKLKHLERKSGELRKQRLRTSGRGSGSSQVDSAKDW